MIYHDIIYMASHCRFAFLLLNVDLNVQDEVAKGGCWVGFLGLCCWPHFLKYHVLWTIGG